MGNAVADEVIIALTDGTVIDLDQVLVDGLEVVALDASGLTNSGAIGNP